MTVGFGLVLDAPELPGLVRWCMDEYSLCEHDSKSIVVLGYGRLLISYGLPIQLKQPTFICPEQIEKELLYIQHDLGLFNRIKLSNIYYPIVKHMGVHATVTDIIVGYDHLLLRYDILS